MYDTGGLSIKTKTGMPGMKRDCGGAAAVLGAFYVAVRNGFTGKVRGGVGGGHVIEVQFLIPVSIVSKLALVPVSCIFKFWFSHEMSLFSDFNNLIIVVFVLR